jgi:uncharacterized protein YprB with RNaseH-like and TPR domain
LIAPVHRLKKDQILSLARWRCEHGHTGLEHYQCYLKQCPKQEVIGFLDCETNNLDSDFGILLSYAIKEFESDTIYKGVLEKSDTQSSAEEDKRLVGRCVKDLLKFDRVITWYGKKFDLPFIRTRALICGVDFPFYGGIKHNDIYYIAKYRLKLHSNRLENVCRVLFGETQKTHIDARYWRGALRGDKTALAYILDHNIRDVMDLERVYLKLRDYAKPTDTSI